MTSKNKIWDKMIKNIFGDKCRIEKNEPINKIDIISNELASMYVDKILLNIKKIQEQENMVIDSIIEHDDGMFNVLLPNMRKMLNELQKVTCEFDDEMFFKIENDSDECYIFYLQSSSIAYLKKYIHASNNVVELFENSELSEHNQILDFRVETQRVWYNEFVKSFALECGYNLRVWKSSIKKIKTKVDLNKTVGNSFNLIPVPSKIYKLCESDVKNNI